MKKGGFLSDALMQEERRKRQRRRLEEQRQQAQTGRDLAALDWLLSEVALRVPQPLADKLIHEVKLIRYPIPRKSK